MSLSLLVSILSSTSSKNPEPMRVPPSKGCPKAPMVNKRRLRTHHLGGGPSHKAVPQLARYGRCHFHQPLAVRLHDRLPLPVPPTDHGTRPPSGGLEDPLPPQGRRDLQQGAVLLREELCHHLHHVCSHRDPD